MPSCDPKLGAIIDRLVERDAGARFPSADALLTALEDCAAPSTALAVPAGNPYRGLAVFDAAHGALFFGRRNEIRELVDRVSTEPLVVVGGDSGTGKSSVCRAGVLPFLVENEGWTRVDLAPGRWPVQSFAAALAAWSGVDEAALAGMITSTSTVVARRQVQGRKMQGRKMQGRNLQGLELEHLSLVGFRYAGATLDGTALANLRVVKGELVAERLGVNVRGTSLAGAHIFAATDGVQLVDVEYRIVSVQPELAQDDPTNSGNTFLYRIEQFATDTWVDACDPDEAGRSAAIPVAMTWDDAGTRAPSAHHFTFGCTSAAIGKCYRWGYRPWLTGYGGANFSDLHQTCTRAARADYCGDGRSFTEDGTSINIWDRLPPRARSRRTAGYRRSAICSKPAGTPTVPCVSAARAGSSIIY
jgi:ADYC domain